MEVDEEHIPPWAESATMLDCLRDAVNHIEQWRAPMSSRTGGDDGVGVPENWGPKPPFNMDCMVNADQYAARLATLAIHAENLGYVPPLPLKGLVWRGGKAVGLKPVDESKEFDSDGEPTGADPYGPVRVWVRQLRTWIPSLVHHRELWPQLRDVYRSWRLAKAVLEKRPEEWLTKQQVCEKYGLADRTVQDWGDGRAVRIIDDYGERLYLAEDVKFYKESAEETQRQNRLRIAKRA
ncbi:hypothetical protein [Corynebacterium pyruviciproducens]